MFFTSSAMGRTFVWPNPENKRELSYLLRDGSSIRLLRCWVLTRCILASSSIEEVHIKSNSPIIISGNRTSLFIIIDMYLIVQVLFIIVSHREKHHNSIANVVETHGTYEQLDRGPVFRYC